MLFPADSLRKDVHGIVKVGLAICRCPAESRAIHLLTVEPHRPGPTAATRMTLLWQHAAGKLA